MLGSIKGRIIGLLRGDPNMKKLTERGLTVGKNFKMLGGCIIDHSHSCLIKIGDDVTFAPRVHVLAHDASTKYALGYTRIALTTIGDRVFIGGGSIIMPGVNIGSDSIVGAGSVVTRDVEEGSVVAGNPARTICSTSDYLERQKRELERLPVFGEEFTLAGGVDSGGRAEMVRLLEEAGGKGFIR